MNTQTKWPATRPPAKSQAGKNWSALNQRDLEALKNFNSLPDDAGVRVGVVAKLFGISNCTVWRGGDHLPTPVKLGPGSTIFMVGQIRAKLRAAAARGAA